MKKSIFTIFLVIVANIVFDSTIYAKRWMTLVELKDVVGSYTTSEDGIKLNDAKFNYPFTKMRLTFTKTTTSLYSYMCVDYVEPNSLALEFSFRGDNPSFGDYLVNHTNVYKQIKNQGTLVSGNTYEYDLNVLCGTMGREFYASSWQKNFLPEQVEIYVDDNTIENQQFTIYFDANDGIIPSGGNMGNTPTGHITSLSGDQKKGSVVVTYGENAFSEMCADCPVREGYVFTGWFTSPSNGDPVYDATGVAVTEKYWEYLDDKFKWIGTSNIQLYAHWKNDISPTMHPGTLPGIFSVSDTTQIYFSQGNLQFRKSSFFPHKCADGTVQNGTWRFAENQYDNVGEQNINTSASYSKWIDMFGWGTSGWSGTGAMAYQPYSTSSKSSDYYQGIIRDSYRFADWGVYNAIVNGGNEPEQWRCPTIQELDYLFYKRQNASSLYAAGRIDTINGLILLPDNWQTPATLVFKPSIISFLDNVYTLEEWKQMENAGAVFLPATGYYVREQALKARNVGCWYVSSDTLHYSTTGHSPAMIRFTEDSLNLYAGHGYWGGRSVRLVKDVIKGSGEGSIPTIEKDTCNVRVTISIDNLPRTLCTDISKYTDKDIIKGEKRFSIPITSIAYKLGTIYGLNYINIVPISPSGKCYGYISDCYANRGTYYDRSSHWTYGHTVTKDGYVFFDLQSIEKGVWTLTCVQKHAGTWL